jgi:hypothetical protein
LFAVADEAPQLFLALRRRSAIAVGGDLELVNRDTPLGGYLEDVVEEAAGDGDVD